MLPRRWLFLLLCAAVLGLADPLHAQSSTLFVELGPLRYSPVPGMAAALSAFAAADDAIDAVVTDLPSGQPPDCRIDAFNNALTTPLTDRLSDVLPLSDYFTTDDERTADFAPQLLERASSNGEIIAFPLFIHPVVLAIDPFYGDQIQPPTGNDPWTPEQLDAALRSFSPQNQISYYRLTTRGGPENAFIRLIELYGGQSVDLDGTQPIPRFTAPETAAAVEYVVQQINNERIGYDSFSSPPRTITWGLEPLMVHDLSISYDDDLSGFSRRIMMLFPFSPDQPFVDIRFRAGFVSAQTAQADACIRLFDALSSTTDMMDGLPARRSVAATGVPAFPGLDAELMYRQLETVLAGTELPPADPVLRSSGYRAGYWLLHALEQIVDGGVPIEEALAAAQTGAQQFIDCAYAVDASGNGISGYSAIDSRQYGCILADPTAQNWPVFPG